MTKKLFTLLLAVAASVGTMSAAITVRLDPSSCSSWSTVRLWAWTDNGNIFDAWPGQIVNQDGDGWYSYTFDASITSVSIIWNNGSDQTMDITDVTSSTCYALKSTSGWSIDVSVVNCSSGSPVDDVDYSHIQIGDLYYNLDATNQTAEVTSQNSSYPYWSTTITTAIIPASVTYNSVSYSVTNIGDSAFFYYCTGLTSVTIPNSVTSIGNEAFAYCTGLTSVTIPNSVTSIGEAAFLNCSGLTSVTIGNGVSSIGRWTFESCSGLTSVTIGNSVTSIGDGAFLNCSGLTSITCEATTPPTLGSGVFSSVDKSIPLYVPAESVSAYQSADKWKDFTNILPIEETPGTCITASGECGENLTWELSCDSVLTISGSGEMANYSNVPSVPWYSYNSSIQYVVIGNSVTSIGSSAFYGCDSLTSVTIPNSVTSIGDSAFVKCYSLTSVHISDLAAWCNIAFSSYDSNPFYYAKHLYVNNVEVTNLVIPEGVTSIGKYAFAYCTSLTSVTIPNSVTSIGNWAFENCTGLTSVTIPNSVTSIGWGAFEGCSGLTSITIPNSLTSIGWGAFEGCSGLTSISNYANTPQEINSYVFDLVDKSTCILYVPLNSVDLYKAAEGWKEFGQILPISAEETEAAETTVETTETSAEITWPAVSGAATYELVIKDKGGNVICTLIFNANGQLTQIAFNAPSRNGAPQQTQAAGFSFTVTGLEDGTSYDLTITSKDNNGGTLDTKTVSFKTTGAATGIEEVPSDQVPSTKFLRDGQIFILRGEKVYTIQGQEVK